MERLLRSCRKRGHIVHKIHIKREEFGERQEGRRFFVREKRGKRCEDGKMPPESISAPRPLQEGPGEGGEFTFTLLG